MQRSKLQNSLSIILPVHNEEEGLETTITKIWEAVRVLSVELLCVENESSDNSLAILHTLSKKNKHVKIIRSEKGWGNAVRKGVLNSKGQYICYMVSDGQINPKHIVTLFKMIEKLDVDMVKVSRIKRENFLRYLNSRIYNFIAQTIFQIDSKDINATPKIIKRKHILKMLPSAPNIAFDLELLLSLKKNKMKWIEVPVESEKRSGGISTTSIFSIFEMLLYILKFRLLSFFKAFS